MCMPENVVLYEHDDGCAHGPRFQTGETDELWEGQPASGQQHGRDLLKKKRSGAGCEFGKWTFTAVRGPKCVSII